MVEYEPSPTDERRKATLVSAKLKKREQMAKDTLEACRRMSHPHAESDPISAVCQVARDQATSLFIYADLEKDKAEDSICGRARDRGAAMFATTPPDVEAFPANQDIGTAAGYTDQNLYMDIRDDQMCPVDRHTGDPLPLVKGGQGRTLADRMGWPDWLLYIAIAAAGVTIMLALYNVLALL